MLKFEQMLCSHLNTFENLHLKIIYHPLQISKYVTTYLIAYLIVNMEGFSAFLPQKF